VLGWRLGVEQRLYVDDLSLVGSRPAGPTPTPSPTPVSIPTPTPSPSPTPTPDYCAGTTTRGTTSYCVGYLFGVQRTLYGVGHALAVRGVAVTSVSGNLVGLSGGPSCLPDEWCGQILPTVLITFPAGGPVPSYGDVIDLYGISSAGSITPEEFDVVGHCDPYWGEC
jgi:hypothetical protein